MNHKNNKAVQTVSTLAGMDSLVNGNKVLIMQLINPDIDTADNTLNKNTDILYGSEKSSFAETGIDSLLRICSGTVIGANEFEQLCTPIRKTKFALDVCEISKNVEFTKTVVSRVEDIKEILNSATQVYQNIYILVDSKDDDVLKTVNELDVVNRSVYCLRQGHMNKGAVYGKNIFYIVTDYHEDSEFSIKAMKNAYVSRKEPIYSLAFNIHATDASMKGRLIHFILHNMNNEKTDVNYEWCKSVKDILIAIENMKEAKEKTSNKDIEEFKPASDTEDYSKFNENAGLIQNVPLVKDIKEPVPAPKKEKKGFFLFGRKKKTEQPKPQEKEELLDLSLNNDFDEDETVDIGADYYNQNIKGKVFDDYEEAENGHVDFDMIVDEINAEFTRMTKKNINDDRLTREEIEKKRKHIATLRTSIERAGWGDANARLYVKNYIKDILVANSKIAVTEDNIDTIIPFNDVEKMSINDRFRTVMYPYMKEFGASAFSKMASPNEWDLIKKQKIGGVEYYIVTREQIKLRVTV